MDSFVELVGVVVPQLLPSGTMLARVHFTEASAKYSLLENRDHFISEMKHEEIGRKDLVGRAIQDIDERLQLCKCDFLVSQLYELFRSQHLGPV